MFIKEFILKCALCNKSFSIKLEKLQNKKYFCCLNHARSYATKNIRNTYKIIKCKDCRTSIKVKIHSGQALCKKCKILHKKEKSKNIQEIEKILNKRISLKKIQDTYIINYSNKEIKLLKNYGYLKVIKHLNGIEYIEMISPEIRKKLSNAGIRSAKVQVEERRSKNEKAFCQLCEQEYKNVKHNENIFNGWDADIILEDYKIAILWNGLWHYKQLNKKHSVKQVQNRDQIKIKEIINVGYIPYIIKDVGKYNIDFVKEQFEKLKNYIKSKTFLVS